MSASRNEKYALKHASPSRVESVRRALDEAEDKAGAAPCGMTGERRRAAASVRDRPGPRRREAAAAIQETLTIAASALLGLVWVSIVALFGIKLKTAYDIETFWVAVPLVCVAVAVWFALVFVDVFGPAWLDASAARGVAPEDDSDARRAVARGGADARAPRGGHRVRGAALLGALVRRPY